MLIFETVPSDEFATHTYESSQPQSYSPSGLPTSSLIPPVSSVVAADVAEVVDVALLPLTPPLSLSPAVAVALALAPSLVDASVAEVVAEVIDEVALLSAEPLSPQPAATSATNAKHETFEEIDENDISQASCATHTTTALAPAAKPRPARGSLADLRHTADSL
jgi:hypothetical protein